MKLHEYNGKKYIPSKRPIDKAKAGDICFAPKESSGMEEDKYFEVLKNDLSLSKFNLIATDGNRYSWSYAIILEPIT